VTAGNSDTGTHGCPACDCRRPVPPAGVPSPARAAFDSRSVHRLLTLLHEEQYRDEEGDESTPGGVVLVGDYAARDLGYRQGWNDRARSIIALLRQGNVEAGLVELEQVTR
jgi:hypothetical protein